MNKRYCLSDRHQPAVILRLRVWASHFGPTWSSRDLAHLELPIGSKLLESQFQEDGEIQALQQHRALLCIHAANPGLFSNGTAT